MENVFIIFRLITYEYFRDTIGTVVHFSRDYILCFDVFITLVEKRKISYFGLALNLFQHSISPNQDDLSY